MEMEKQSQAKRKVSVTAENMGRPENQQHVVTALNDVSYHDDCIVFDEDLYDDYFPPGYRFCPYDEELVVHYLSKKVTNQPLPKNKMVEVNLYNHNPEQLTEKYKVLGEKEWYFFTPRDRKYPNGTRPNRAAGDGYWKATGADKVVKCKGATVGFRKALVFYKGKPPKGVKSDWIMHEYRVDEPPRTKQDKDDMRLNDWVLCRIYKKSDKAIKTKRRDDQAVPVQHPQAAPEEGSLPVSRNDAADMEFYFNGRDSTGFVTSQYGDLHHHQPLQMRGLEVQNYAIDQLSHPAVVVEPLRSQPQLPVMPSPVGMFEVQCPEGEPFLHVLEETQEDFWSLEHIYRDQDTWNP